jgi:hypothetical protein
MFFAILYRALALFTSYQYIVGQLNYIFISPGRGREFFSSPPRPKRFWGQLSLLSNGYHGIFPWV